MFLESIPTPHAGQTFSKKQVAATVTMRLAEVTVGRVSPQGVTRQTEQPKSGYAALTRPSVPSMGMYSLFERK